jgi:hypothetical protein
MKCNKIYPKKQSYTLCFYVPYDNEDAVGRTESVSKRIDNRNGSGTLVWQRFT